MIYTPTKKEFETVAKLVDDNSACVDGIDKRLKYFLSVAAWNIYFWLRKNKSQLLLDRDENDKQYLRVWPAKAYAELILTKDEMKNLKRMSIFVFIENKIDKLIRDDVYINVLSNKGSNGAIISAKSFRELLLEESIRRNHYYLPIKEYQYKKYVTFKGVNYVRTGFLEGTDDCDHPMLDFS